jgi:hypothetical protein
MYNYTNYHHNVRSSILGGSGYTNGTFPFIITGGGGSGCTGTFNVGSGGVASMNIVDGGTGYTSAPTFRQTN